MSSSLFGGAAGSSYRLLLDPAPVEGGGTTPPPAKEPEKAPTPDPTEGFKAALGKHNNDALGLARESYSAAETLRTQLAQVQSKLPKDGAVVLAGDDAEAWKAYKALGKPDVIKATVEEHGTLKTQVAQRARLDLYSEIGKAHDWNAAAVADVPGIADLDLILKDGTKNGKPAKVAHIKEVTKDSDGKDVVKETPLEKYIRDTRPHLMPALTAVQSGASKANPARPAPIAQTDPNARRRPLARF